MDASEIGSLILLCLFAVALWGVLFWMVRRSNDQKKLNEKYEHIIIGSGMVRIQEIAALVSRSYDATLNDLEKLIEYKQAVVKGGEKSLIDKGDFVLANSHIDYKNGKIITPQVDLKERGGLIGAVAQGLGIPLKKDYEVVEKAPDVYVKVVCPRCHADNTIVSGQVAICAYCRGQLSDHS